MTYLAIIYFLFLTVFAWKNFRLSVGWLILILPAYLIRLNIGPLPTTLLEITWSAIFLVWLLKYFRSDWPGVKKVVKENKWLAIFFGVFFIASILGVVVSDMWYYSLGQWRAYFFEPMLFCLVVVARRKEISGFDLIKFFTFSAVSVSFLAVIQKLFGVWYPPSLWNDDLRGRVTSFFTTPNAVGLYLAPIFFLTLGWLFSKKELREKNKILFYSLIFILILMVLAVGFSLSKGAWAAMILGGMLFVFLLGYKKIATVIIALILLASLSVPVTRQVLFFQQPSGSNRLLLWDYTTTFLTASPKNFVLGAGIRQFFRKVQKPFYNPEKMERLIYPHNLFLNFWSEVGLFGVVSFVGLWLSVFFRAIKIWRRETIIGAALVSALIVFAVHGLVDVSYFKNDLAFVWWILFVVVNNFYFESKK